MQVAVPVHSVVDVITNSSTVIYTSAAGNAIDVAKEIINEVLGLAGSEKSADDLFDFRIQVRPEDCVDWAIYDAGEEWEEIPTVLQTLLDNPVHKEKREAVTTWVKENQDTLDALFTEKGVHDDYDDYPKYINHLIVTTKDGTETGLANRALGLFSQYAVYDG